MSEKDLPELTAKQFAFVKGLLEGKTASDAYRAAYDCDGCSNESIWVAASRLRNDPKVSLWLSRARTEALTSATMTKEAYIQELLTERMEAKATGNHGAAVKALELAGKVMGHYVDRVEDVTEKGAVEQVLAEIEKENPHLATLLKGGLH